MQQIEVKTTQSRYDVIVGAPVLELRSYLKFEGGLVLIEKPVSHLVDCDALGLPFELVDGGEAIKTLTKIETFYQLFLDHQLDKSSVVVAVGGGAVTDAVAFAAATFNRGMPCVTVPTTLLAQVDASIGGKNGVNFAGTKNLIGTIVQPKLVLCDLSFLKTLPSEELSNGVAEIIKAGVIADPSLIELLGKSADSVFGLDLQVLETVISRAIQVKADIVSRDEKESGERMKLNLGHTIGHALEASCKISHGQAVACGMILEAKLANKMGLCSESLVSMLETLCKQYRLPIAAEFDVEEVCRRILNDKKRRSTEIKFALPRAIGQVEIVPISIYDIEKHISDLRLA